MRYSLVFMRENPNLMIDPFSDLLRLLNARSVASGGLIAGGAWALEVPAPKEVKFWGVARGSCWMNIQGAKTAIRLDAGEVLLMTAPHPLVIASDLQAPRTSLDELLSTREGPIAYLGHGEEVYMIGGNVKLEHANAPLLLGALPPYIHVGAQSPRSPTLLWLLKQLISESAENQPGASAVSSQLAHLMFIQILRAHAESATQQVPGWLRAVSDKRLEPALRLIHNDPARTWQLDELAAAAAMSRAAFAAYFKAVAGIAPVAYLTAWRMRLAQRALREEQVSLAALADRLGYASDSAFSNAFKRLTGMSPKHYRESTSVEGA